MTPEASFERGDAYQVAAETALGIGDLAAARAFAQRLADFASYRDVPHLALARLLVVDALAGEWDAVIDNGSRWLASWESAGRPVVSNLAAGPRALALVHGLRGEDVERARWDEVGAALRSVIEQLEGAHDVFAPMVTAQVQVHRGEFADAVATLVDAPDRFDNWFTARWSHWYAPVWVEAAVLAGRDDAAERLACARFVVAGDRLATALLDRAAALLTGDRPGLLAAAAVLREAGCRYQWARTLALAGGVEGARGRAALDALGAMPMAVPEGTAPS